MSGADQAILADRLRRAAQPIADDARLRASRWSRRVPLSIRLQGGASRITIAAGGARAPQAGVMEGKPSGAPRAHPVYARGPREDWTWADQIPVRPFLAEAVDAKIDECVEIFSGIIEDWGRELGYHERLWQGQHVLYGLRYHALVYLGHLDSQVAGDALDKARVIKQQPDRPVAWSACGSPDAVDTPCVHLRAASVVMLKDRLIQRQRRLA